MFEMEFDIDRTNIRTETQEKDLKPISPREEDFSPANTWNLRNNKDSDDAGDTSNDGKHTLLEFAMSNFRESNFDGIPQVGSIKQKKKRTKKTKNSSKSSKSDWTWKDPVERVKWTERMIENSLIRSDQIEMNKIAIECFASLMRYMGDLALPKNQRVKLVNEADCALTILSHCYKFDDMRDEVYCQVMKQTTNNKSFVPDSCQKGWRLFSIIAAHFTCSDHLKPFLFKYIEMEANDENNAYHGMALVCLYNLRKTFKYGGRKMAPHIEEITAMTAGRNYKRQIYRLPGGTERVINTESTTVVEDIVKDLCPLIGVTSVYEREEFCLFCIIEGQTFTQPLFKGQYILDVTTDLQNQGAIYDLIFCRFVWHFPLRLDNELYTEVVFNQIAPDYLEGLLLVMPSEQMDQEVVHQVLPGCLNFRIRCS